MDQPVNLLLPVEKIDALISQLKTRFEHYFDQKKHRVNFKGPDDQEFTLRYPLPYSYEDVAFDPQNCYTQYIICIIQSGSAALAYCEGMQVIEHKVFKAYMVRKKQGKSQLKYLKTKGKSKAGSRVRLGNTTHFFEEITEKLEEWLNYYEIEKVALSLNKTLYPYLFNKDNEVLNKNDERIFKIPKHIEEPSFGNLLKIHSYLLMGELSYHESQKALLEPIVNNYKK